VGLKFLVTLISQQRKEQLGLNLSREIANIDYRALNGSQFALNLCRGRHHYFTARYDE